MYIVTASSAPSGIWTVACPSVASAAPSVRQKARQHTKAGRCAVLPWGYSHSLYHPVQEVDDSLPLHHLGRTTRRWMTRLCLGSVASTAQYRRRNPVLRAMPL